MRRPRRGMRVLGTDDRTCMFCGGRVADPGEAYYDHLRASKGCEAAWRFWRDSLVMDHPGGD